MTAKCRFKSSEIQIKTTSDATINVGDNLSLKSNAVSPDVADVNMTGVQLASGTAKLESPEEAATPAMDIKISPG